MDVSWDNDEPATSYSHSNKSRHERSSRDSYSRTSYRYSDSFDIEVDQIGMIIGRGGSNIREVQHKYKVNVNVDKNTKSVKVTGNRENDVKDAIYHIKKQIRNSKDSRRNNSKDRKNYSRHGERDRSCYKHNDDKHRYPGREHSSTDEEDNKDKFVPINWAEVNERAKNAQDEKWINAAPVIKNFYKESREVRKLSSEEAEEIRANNNNTTVVQIIFSKEFSTEYTTLDARSGLEIPNPVWKFEHCFADYPDLLREINKQNFEKPSPIQSSAWPILLKGCDMIGIAQTGTGKTLAFLLPAMIHTEFQSIPRRERKGPTVLILAPTRELALQIDREVAKYSFRDMKSACVYGGGDRNEQINALSEGVEIVIATPGRLYDLTQANHLSLGCVSFLVLDEADRMLDLGFEPQIRKILIDVRPDRQTVMTSATWPPGVRRLANSYMKDPIQVCVGTLDLAAVHTVNQIIEVMDESEKYNRILRFVKSEMAEDDKVIIFCGKKARADDLSSDFSLENIKCQCIHGSRDQHDREQAIDDITTGYVKILIATDVASRGLDIEDITYVVNYDFPNNIEEYVHRVGRTGRAGRQGTSITFMTRSDWGHADELINILKEANQTVPEELYNMADRFKNMLARRKNENESFGGSRRKSGKYRK